MALAPDTAYSLRSAVALVNSEGPPDRLRTLDQLDRFFEEFEYTGSRRRNLPELREVRATRSTLRPMLLTSGAAGVLRLNAVLRDAQAVPQLVRHDGHGWHWHAFTDEAPLATRIVVETAMAMAELHRAHEGERLRPCPADGCTRLVLDLSRNRSRRFCSTACSNRLASAAYRRRRRLAAGPQRGDGSVAP